MERDRKIEEFYLRVQLLAGDSKMVPRLQVQVTARDAELNAIRVLSLQSSKPSEAMTRAHESLQSKVDAFHSAGELWEGVLRDFAEIVCTGYSALRRMHDTNYRSRVNAILSVAQSRVNYVGCYRICVGEDCY